VSQRLSECGDTQRAVAEELTTGARTISSAALIMVAVLMIFVASGLPSIQQIGLGIAVAMAVDATTVRHRARWAAWPYGRRGRSARTRRPFDAASRALWLRASAAAHEPTYRAHELIGQLGLGIALCAHHAMPSMVVQEAEGHLVQRGLSGADLREDVNAVAVVFDHALYASHLSLDPSNALEQLVLGGGVAAALLGG
jgi:hypothetical protein